MSNDKLTPAEETAIREYIRNGGDQSAAKQYYVYALIDPRDGRAFYIGKGKGNRLTHHVRGARNRRDRNAEKSERIREIERSGLVVIEKVLRTFACEDDALNLEAKLINRLQARLTNITHCRQGALSQEGKRAKAIAWAKSIYSALSDAPPSHALSDVLDAAREMLSMVEEKPHLLAKGIVCRPGEPPRYVW